MEEDHPVFDGLVEDLLEVRGLGPTEPRTCSMIARLSLELPILSGRFRRLRLPRLFLVGRRGAARHLAVGVTPCQQVQRSVEGSERHVGLEFEQLLLVVERTKYRNFSARESEPLELLVGPCHERPPNLLAIVLVGLLSVCVGARS